MIQPGGDHGETSIQRGAVVAQCCDHGARRGLPGRAAGPGLSGAVHPLGAGVERPARPDRRGGLFRGPAQAQHRQRLRALHRDASGGDQQRRGDQQADHEDRDHAQQRPGDVTADIERIQPRLVAGRVAVPLLPRLQQRPERERSRRRAWPRPRSRPAA